MDVRLLPYCEIDGIPTFADSDILNIYDRIVDEGKEYIFKDGTLCDKLKFLAEMKARGTLLYIIYYKKELLGIVWLNRFEGRLARLHWCTFSGVSTKIKIQTCRYVNEEIINMRDAKNNYVFDLLIGYTPVSNSEAIHFIRLCGGIVGEAIPNLIWNSKKGESELGVISYYSRDEQVGVVD